MAVLQVENLTKKFGTLTAVNNLSFSIQEGETVGFVGKNGAGKSTTIRCLMNFLTPNSGSCHILGMDVKKHHKTLGGLCGYMPSDAEFPAGITAKELFDFCVKISGAGTGEIDELCQYFELDATKQISKLSLGNRKKVSIIQALLRDSKVLVLDEPTNGLDPLMQEKFFSLLNERKKTGLTIFLSSHNLMEVERYCDRVLIIKNGILQDDIDIKNTNIKKSYVVNCTLKDGTSQTFEHESDANSLVANLSKLDLADIEIRTKRVHDNFIKYYKEDL